MRRISEINMFRAFRSRNYSLYFMGRSIAQFGTWMQRTTVVWVVYSITHSAFLIGVTIFAEQFPAFLFSVLGGVTADRYERYRILKVTQSSSMVQAVLLAALVITGHTVVWAILALSVLLGVINAFDLPARQALVNDVVADPSDLPNALSLTIAMASLAQLLGPALAGIILSAAGAGVCFLINAASFGAVILALALMKLPHRPPKKSDKKVIEEFVEGFEYLGRTPDIGLIILMLALVSFLVLPYNTVLPIFAKVVFRGNASTFGYITSFIGVGAVGATIFITSRRPGTHLRRILLFNTVALGVGLICFSQIKSFPVAMFFGALAGFGSISQYTLTNIIAQSESAPQMRGRVIGILIMAIFGTMPLGSLLIGAVSQRLGAPATVLCQGIIGIVIVLAFARVLRKPGKGIVRTDPATEAVQELIEENIA